MVTEPLETADRLRQAVEQVRASYADAVAREDPAPPPATLQVDDGEADGWLAGATTLDALEIAETPREGAGAPRPPARGVPAGSGAPRTPS